MGIPPHAGLRLVVAARREISSHVDEFVLAAENGRPLAPYTPGSHLPLKCGAVVNAYSLTGEGYEPDFYRIAVRRQGAAGGSAWLHRNAVPGAMLVASAPRSAFPPILAARHHLMLSAGIGITPMISHLRAGARWQRSVEVVAGFAAGQALFREELQALVRARGARLTEVVGRGAILDAVTEALARQPIGTHAYACGPASFLDAVAAEAAWLGWPAGRVHIEHFDAPVLDEGEPFTARIRSTGARVEVPAGTSLLSALDAQEITVDRMCERGVCGRCSVGVVSGRVLHRDLVLTPAERARGDQMMACVSRARTPELELDL